MQLSGRPFLIRILALALLAGATVLGVLVVQWANAAARGEELQLRAVLSVGAARVRREAVDEVWVLTSFLAVSPAELSRGDWQRAEKMVHFWLQSSSFPGLLQAAYIIPDVESSQGFVYSSEEQRYVRAPIPAELLGLVRSQIAARKSGSGREQETASEAAGYIVLTANGQSPDAAAAQSPGAVAVRLDLDALYTRLVPDLVGRHLEGFSYRIRDVKSGAVLAEAGTIPAGAKPEAVVGLSELAVGFPRSPFAEMQEARSGPPEGATSLEDDPFLRYWIFRLHTEKTLPGPAPAQGVELEIYHPRGSIVAAVELRRVLSIAVSVGILTILVVSAFVLYRLYRRSAQLRASEQEFVASVSHELRTPITVIQATSENLKRGVVTEQARVVKYAGVIYEQVRRLAGMVESILFYSGLQSGAHRSPARAEVDLPLLIGEISTPLREVAAERGATLVVDTSRIPERVRSDATALRLVVENLLMNAIRHGGPGEIRLSMTGEADALRIVVEDDGPGIPAREQSRVFEPFVRGSRSLREQKPGSGLGLHLVRRVSEGLGGRVRLESPYRDAAGVEHAGCRFTVTLPLREEPAHG